MSLFDWEPQVGAVVALVELSRSRWTIRMTYPDGNEVWGCCAFPTKQEASQAFNAWASIHGVTTEAAEAAH